MAVLIVTAISAAALLATPASDSGAPSASSSQQAAAGAPVSLAGLTRTFARVLAALTVVVHWRAGAGPPDLLRPPATGPPESGDEYPSANAFAGRKEPVRIAKTA